MYSDNNNEVIISKKIEIMKNEFRVIKRFYGIEQNQVNENVYATKEEAIIAGNNWLIDNKYCGENKGKNFEVILK